MCSSQFKVPLVRWNVTSVNPSSDFLLVQSICSCIQLQIPAWDLEGILGMNLLITDLPVSTEWPEITQRSCRNVSRVMLFSYHDCCLELWSVCMLSTKAYICVYMHVCVCAARAQEWSLALACSSADTWAKGTCSCVILSLWPCYEWRPLGAGSRERQTDPQLMVVLMLLIRTVSGKLKFSPGPKVELTGFLPAVKRKTAKPLWQHLVPWHWTGTRHTHIHIHTHLNTRIASLKSSCV